MRKSTEFKHRVPTPWTVKGECMVYKKNFVAAVKVGGQVLRESNDHVELSFGSEYSVLLKNLDSVRMQARISIDGTEATPWLIVEPGRDIEVERFVKDLEKGNRFKFIERTERIEQHRGIKAEDGLVRIEFKREKVYDVSKVVEHHTYHHHYDLYPYCWPPYYGRPYRYSQSGWFNSINSAQEVSGGLLRSSQNTRSVSCASTANCSVNDVGITVSGSSSDQKFQEASGFETDQAEVLVLHLVGKSTSGPVKVAKTVKRKLECETCGKKNKSDAKFCKECGTSLEKVGG